MDIALAKGLMVEFEHAVLEQACQQGAEWRAAGHDLTVNVNCCPDQISNIENFETKVHKALAASGLPADRLVCELTEHALLDTGVRTAEGIGRLNGHGVEFSVDDFGTGYASMTYLATLPMQEIKVDRRFVNLLPQDKSAVAIVRAVGAMARELGMRCVAEGVEDDATDAVVTELGATHGQGYWYARPVPADRFRELLDGSHPVTGC